MTDESVTDDREWPTPSFDRADTMYECAGHCGAVVNPKAGDKQAGLLIAGRTEKLCAECAGKLNARLTELKQESHE